MISAIRNCFTFERKRMTYPTMSDSIEQPTPHVATEQEAEKFDSDFGSVPDVVTQPDDLLQLGVGIIERELADLTDHVADADRAASPIDSLRAAMSSAQNLIARISSEIKSAEANIVSRQFAKADAEARNLGYAGLEEQIAKFARHGLLKLPEPTNDHQADRVDQTDEKANVKRYPYPKAPAVYQFKSTIDPSKGFTGSLRGAKGDWVKKHADGKPDMNYFREATTSEIAEMQLLRDEYIKSTDKMREDRAAKKQ